MHRQPAWSVENPLRFWTLWSVFVCSLGLVGGMGGETCVWAETDAVILKQPLSPAVQEIEVIYVDGQAPTVSLRAPAAPAPPVPFRPTGERVDLLPLLGEGRAFGGCEVSTAHTPESLVVHLQAPNSARCGYTVALQRAGVGVDGLSYETLHLRGHVLGRVTLALADEIGRAHV